VPIDHNERTLRKRALTLIIVCVSLSVLASAAALVYRIFFLKLTYVPQGAMANTILAGDYVFVIRTFSDIERGWIVVFKYPGDSSQYIARVVGLPGETIQVRDRSVIINGKPLEEQRVSVKPQEPGDFGPLAEISTNGTGPYRVFYTEGGAGSPDDLTFGIATPFQIPKDSYFVLGDNRDNSLDSRTYGVVPRHLIWGRASSIYWSTPVYSDDVRWERVFKPVH
jgi:signal peptidase I